MADENTARLYAEEYTIRTAEISKLGKNIDKLRECYHSMNIFVESANMADFILRNLLIVRPDIFGPFASDDSLKITRINMRRIFQKFKLLFHTVEMNYCELKEKLDKGYDDKFAYQFWWYIFRKTTEDHYKVFRETRDKFMVEIAKDKTESIFKRTVYLKMDKQVQELIDNFKATEQHLIDTDGTIRGKEIKSDPAVYEDNLFSLKSDMCSSFEKYKCFYRLLFPESQDSDTKMKEKVLFALYLLPVEAKLKYDNLLLECQEECLSKTKRLMEWLIIS